MTVSRGPETDPLAPRRLHWGALAVFAVVLGAYVFTLAPSVTFWDAGEFIAAAKILGIPHPPGTPLFILIAHVWGTLFPAGEFAYRTNFMTATFSAAGAGLFFLLVARGLQGRVVPALGEGAPPERDRLFVIGGAAAAAVTSAFAFTVWQNSNETEVYMVAAFSIAAICWLAWLWRKHRGGVRAPHLLLLIVFLGAISIGNHLLTLLVGPALIFFMWHVQRNEPLADPQDRRIEWAQWLVVVGVWALLIGTGLGSAQLLALGGVIFVAAAIYAATTGALRFALAVLGLALLGASTYLFLYLRAQHGPFINEADPSTLENLIAVIRREQYPPRTPIDNPIDPSGARGRTFNIMYWQALNYLQYFDWQWSNGLAATEPVFATVRLPFTLIFSSLGIYGASVLHDRDRSVFWLLVVLFLATGPGLMGYMNFKPGFSLAWDQYTSMDMHEVRERDYFFVVSFQVWGLLAGIGMAGLYRLLRERVGQADRRSDVQERRVTSKRLTVRTSGGVAALVFGLAVLPFVLNFTAASRRHGPASMLARDFAYDLLQTVEPYGILITNGDNDTFPLWYLQEVEEVRQDVVVVNLSLANTDWYIRQLRDNPVRPFDPEQAPWFADLAPAHPPPLKLSWSDEEIAGLRSLVLPRASVFRAGSLAVTLPENMPLYVMNIVTLQLIRENWEQRPVYFAMTAGVGQWMNMERYLTQEALAFKLNIAGMPDSSRLAPGLFGADVRVDVPRTQMLVDDVYRYAGLFEADTLALDPTSENIALNLSYVFYGLGQAYDPLGDDERSIENLRRGYHLNPIPQVRDMIRAAETGPVEFGDTVIPPAPVAPRDTP
jgi:hypothetical protein